MARSVARQRTNAAALPQWIRPQLTRLVDAAPEGSDWLHEIKYDGYRMHARLDQGTVKLLTRTGLDWAQKYPSIAAAVASLPVSQAYLDGELCGVGPDGVTSFSMIQLASDTGNAAALTFFLFDLLYLDGEHIAARALIERKAGRWTNSCRMQLHPCSTAITRPGMAPPFIRRPAPWGSRASSKRADAVYAPGGRGLWLKVKCLHREEFVVVALRANESETS